MLLPRAMTSLRSRRVEAASSGSSSCTNWPAYRFRRGSTNTSQTTDTHQHHPQRFLGLLPARLRRLGGQVRVRERLEDGNLLTRAQHVRTLAHQWYRFTCNGEVQSGCPPSSKDREKRSHSIADSLSDAICESRRPDASLRKSASPVS